MYVFSSLEAATRYGFRWFSFSPSDRLHLVELDRSNGGGRRLKELAFAVPSAEELDEYERREAGSRVGPCGGRFSRS